MPRWKKEPRGQDKRNKEEENNPDDHNDQNRNKNEKKKKKNFLQKFFGSGKDKMKRLKNVTSDQYEIIKEEENNPDDKNEQNRNINEKKEKMKKMTFGKYMWRKVVEEHDEPIEKKKTLLEETKELMVLEQEIYIGGSKDNERTNEIESRYKDLEERVSRVIIDSISKMDEIQLKEAIQAILEQDRVRRPSQQSWKTEWIKWVSSSVTKGMNIQPGSRLAEVLGNIGKAMKKDLIHVIKNLKPLYPKEFDVCNTYAQQYLRVLQYEINLVTDYTLNEVYLLLDWTKIIYPRILGDAALADHINMAQLGELLPPEKISHLKNMYIHQLKGNLKELLTKALERRKWEREHQPVLADLTLYSDLYVDIIQICDSGIQPAREISEDLVDKATSIMVNEFLEFLHRYERLFTIFVKNQTKNIFRDIVIVNMNCCYRFRDFTEGTRADVDIKQQIYSVLTKIKKEGYSILLQDLFKGIKSDFRRIGQTRGLNSEEIMSQIITTAITYMSKITALEAPCRQVMAGEVHKHLVKEYLARIIDIRHHNIKQQEDLADEMHNTADLLTTFCTDHLNDAQVSEAEWMNDAIHRIAEIIRLQDVEAIKMEVGALANKYPDISQRHVMAFLYIKGNLKFSTLKSIVNILQSSISHRDGPERRLFTSIPTYSSSNGAVCVQTRRIAAQISECCGRCCCS